MDAKLMSGADMDADFSGIFTLELSYGVIWSMNVISGSNGG